MKSNPTVLLGLVVLAIWLLPACQSESPKGAGEQSEVEMARRGAGVDPEDFPPGSFGERMAAVLQEPSPQGKIFEAKQLKFEEGGVIFAAGSDQQELNELARIMKANPTLVVEVSVFVEKGPEGAQNLERFAKNRSYFIKNHLINEGADKVNIETKGFEANDYNTKAGQPKDRVEIRILGI